MGTDSSAQPLRARNIADLRACKIPKLCLQRHVRSHFEICVHLRRIGSAMDAVDQHDWPLILCLITEDRKILSIGW